QVCFKGKTAGAFREVSIYRSRKPRIANGETQRRAKFFWHHASDPLVAIVGDIEEPLVSRNLTLEGANLVGEPRLGPFVKLHVVPIVILDALARRLWQVGSPRTATRNIFELDLIGQWTS